MNCNCFMTYILRTKSNAVFYNISTLTPSVCRPKILSRNDIRKSLCSFFIGVRTQNRFHNAVHNDPLILAVKLKNPTNFTACSYHLSFVSNKDKNENVDKINNEKETSEKSSGAEANLELDKNLTLLQKFKLMYKQYWYVLIPVHLVTSIVWYGSFFFAAKSGVDIVPILEKLGITEKFVQYLRDSNAGYYGIAYAMYKIATPARYTVTVGGTTIAINYLKNRGYIKPVPTRQELKVMYEDKKDEFKERREEMRERYHERRDEFFDKYHEKRDEIVDKYHDKRDEMKEKYNERRIRFFDRFRLGRTKANKRTKKKRKPR